jgi:hypothetical protein
MWLPRASTRTLARPMPVPELVTECRLEHAEQLVG